MKCKDWCVSCVLLDEEGKNLLSFETTLIFSSRSGCFYGPHHYIPFFETGKTDILPYHKIHNEQLDLSANAFENLFKELYVTAEYIEFTALRTPDDFVHQAGIIFIRQGKVEVLLSPYQVNHQRMHSTLEEDRTINKYGTYYEPDINNRDRFPQSEPKIEMIPLKTKDTRPMVFLRTGFNRTFQFNLYSKEYSAGWQGIQKIGGKTVFVPGDGSGVAYVRIKINGQCFNVKVMDVKKVGILPVYELGLRTFEMPANMRTKQSLVFLESVQNSMAFGLGAGVFVARRSKNTNPSADIPTDLTEEYFNTLPYSLQIALLDPDRATSLKMSAKDIKTWIPELERLKNLEHLELSTGMTEIPDAIATFTKLKTLTVNRGNITTISPQLEKLSELIVLDLWDNKFVEFPSVVLKLKKLQRLNLGTNEIKSIPDEICTLDKLEYLDIDSTNIKRLPVCMSNNKNLFVLASDMLQEKLPASYEHLFDFAKSMRKN